MRRGRSVPKSPREPEISDVVSVLWRCVSLFFSLVMMMMMVVGGVGVIVLVVGGIVVVG